MRLIDADKLIKFIDLGHLRPPTEVCFSEFDVCMIIERAPTIEAEPVVHCKDCKWFDKQRWVCHNPRYGDGYANYQPPNTNDEYWCADGERSE